VRSFPFLDSSRARSLLCMRGSSRRRISPHKPTRACRMAPHQGGKHGCGAKWNSRCQNGASPNCCNHIRSLRYEALSLRVKSDGQSAAPAVARMVKQSLLLPHPNWIAPRLMRPHTQRAARPDGPLLCERARRGADYLGAAAAGAAVGAAGVSGRTSRALARRMAHRSISSCADQASRRH